MLAQVDEHRVSLPGHKTRDAPRTSRSTPVMVGGAPRIFSLPGLNVFAFFLGQNHVALGPCAVYEWDFEGLRGGSYSLGFRM
jgi:hypothetical protein